MLELKPRSIPEVSRTRSDFETRQPRRLMLALGLLLVALFAVVIRDRDFWFGNNESALDDDATPTQVSKPRAPATAQKAVPAAPAAAADKKTATVAKSAPEVKPAETTVSATRTVLPPLDVEVIAGDSHRAVRPGSNATKVEITNPKSGLSITTGTTNAAERAHLATNIPANIPATVPASQGPYEANYPALAQHMNVEGSVVLQALIGADGVIQNLRVLSGPAILSTAAQQAVRDWHFKPYFQNGQAVETKARITVNFTIKIDSASKVS